MIKKKEYIEPAVLIEDFRISNFIAGCGTIVSQINLTSPETDGCLATDQQQSNSIAGLFIDALGCSITAHTGDSNDGYCYFTYTNSIFTS